MLAQHIRRMMGIWARYPNSGVWGQARVLSRSNSSITLLSASSKNSDRPWLSLKSSSWIFFRWPIFAAPRTIAFSSATVRSISISPVILVIAQLVYVLFGFGSGLIAVGSLALIFPEIKDVVVLLLLVNLPAELFVTWKSRQEIRWKPIAGLGVGIAVGIPVGAWLLSTIDAEMILTVLGWFLVAVGIVFVKLPSGGRFVPPAAAAPPTGLISGVLTGLFGTGGPPVIIWYHLAAVGKSAFRANLMTIFLLMTFIRVPSYAVNGLVTVPRMWSSVMVMPAVLFGAWLGHRLHLQISEQTFRRLVSLLLTALGVVLLIKG